MPADYKYFDNGEERTISSVLDPVNLTSVETNITSGTEHLVTVNSTASLFPGMSFACPNVPPGAFIHAVRSGTVVELNATAWNATTGVFTTNATNAKATAASSGLQAVASGFCPRTIVALTYAVGAWRNLHTNKSNGVHVAGISTTIGAPAVEALLHGYGPGFALLPTAGSISSGTYTPNAFELLKSDHLVSTPLKRHNGEFWGLYILVSTGGFQSRVPAIPGRELIYSGV